MTCPTCKNKILDPYELDGIKYCCPNCAYNRDENTITITPNNVENLFKAVHSSFQDERNKEDENKTN